MSFEKTPEMTRTDPEPFGQRIDGARLIERPRLDQAQRPRRACRRPGPRRRSGRSLWPTTQTGSKTRFLGGGGAAPKRAIPSLRRRRRTDRSTEDARRGHADEEAPIEARVPALQRPITGFGPERLGGPGDRFRRKLRAGKAG